MRDIPLSAIPNQDLTVTLDSNRWTLRIKAGINIMLADIYLNDAPLLMGQRLVAGTPLIPYRFLQGSGNFWFLTENDELPWWERFGVDQLLTYASAGELDA
ncbi:phage baseplate plug family protein [Pseudomonas chlororaphis]|uniref:phage baseplate plug family protein n=1 Tax=Pseudomonas chlororaphis TaxID=587753 RepID=UPI00359C3B0B